MGSSRLKLSGMFWVAAAAVPLASAQILEEVVDLESAWGMAAGGFLQKRQNDAIAGFNETEMAIWNTETSALCEDHLSRLSIASNPTGTAICYNLPSLDTTTGSFMADLRLYQVSTPSGDFTGVPAQQIQVGVEYIGASVSPLTQSVNTRSVDTLVKRQNQAPVLLQSYMMVGQMDMSQMPSPMTIGGVEALLMPKVTLSAGTATAVVSANEASFINGIFSREVVMSDVGLAQLAVDNITAQYQNGTVAFVVPGVNILIQPIGLIITCIWMFVGFAVYGFGTYERYAYREAYRRRRDRDMKGTTGRI